MPTVRVDFNNSDFKKEQVDKLCKVYQDIVGSKVNLETMAEIFSCIRLFNQYGISPLLFFSYCITATAKGEYVNEYMLDGKTGTFITIPISLLNLVEHTVFEIGYIPRMINIEFDPFQVVYEDPQEYETIMNIFIENGLDDIRYKYFLTIQFY